MTSNPTVIAAWSTSTLATGDTVFDAAIAQLLPESVSAGGALADGTRQFLLIQNAVFNENGLDPRLEQTSSRLTMNNPITGGVGPAPRRDDGTWTWIGQSPNTTGHDEDTAQIDFTFGGGDCFNGCQWVHTLRSIVSPGNDIDLYDLGGDPLPDGVELSPATKQWPL